MTPARLRALVAVADTGSVRAAAAQLVVTESAVSAAVAALAADLGVPLVQRAGRGVRLTPSGVVYLGYARRVLGLLDEGRAAAAGELDPTRGRLRLGAVTTAGDHLLPGLVAGFRAGYPHVEISVEVTASHRVWQLLATHQVDLVLAGRPPADLDVKVLAVRANELVCVVAPPLERADPWQLPWLMREPGSGTRATAEAYLAQRQADPPRLVLGSNGAVVAGAVAGLGVALVSRDAVRVELESGRLVVLAAAGTPLRRPWHAVSGPVPTAVTRLFVDHLSATTALPPWCPPRERTRSPALLHPPREADRPEPG